MQFRWFHLLGRGKISTIFITFEVEPVIDNYTGLQLPDHFQHLNALGFGHDYGTIEPGKRAALISVRLPDGVQDVEEYLLSGITAADVTWVPEVEAPAAS